MKYIKKLKIKKVEIVPGEKINVDWIIPMQKIYTSVGIFYDNIMEIHFRDYPAPFNWATVKGKELEVIIIEGTSCKYIKHPCVDI